MYKILELELQGFIGLRKVSNQNNIFKLSLKDDLDKEIIMIFGENGLGKTTLLENLTPFPEMLSRKTKESVTFPAFKKISFLNTKNNKILRLEVFWISEKETKGYIYEDDIILDNTKKGNITEFNTHVSNTFGDFDKFKHSLFLQQGIIEIVKAKPTERVKIINSFMTELDIYNKIKSSAVTELDNGKLILKRLLKDIEELETYENRFNDIISFQKNFDSPLFESEKIKFSELEKHLLDSSIKLSHKKSKESELRKTNNMLLNLEKQNVESQLNEVVSKINKLEASTNSFDETELQKSITSSNKAINNLENLISKLDIDSIFSNLKYNELSSELENTISNNNLTQEKLNSLSIQKKGLSNLLSKTESLNTLNKDKDELQIKFDKIETKILDNKELSLDEVSKDIVNIEQKILKDKEVSANIATKHKEIEANQNKVNSFESTPEKIKSIKKEMEDNNQNKIELKNTENLLSKTENLNTLIKDKDELQIKFDKIETKILDNKELSLDEVSKEIVNIQQKILKDKEVSANIDAKQTEIDNKNKNIDSFTSTLDKISSIKKALNDISLNEVELKKIEDLLFKTEKVNSLNKEKDQLQIKLESYEIKKLNDKDLSLETISNEIIYTKQTLKNNEESTANIKSKQKEIDDKNKKINSFKESPEEISSIKKKILDISIKEVELSKLETSINNTTDNNSCSTCGQSVDIEQLIEKKELLSTEINSFDKKDLESTLETFENEEIEKTTLLAEISSLNNFIKDLNTLSTEEVSSYNEKLENLTIQKINITDYNEFITLTTPILKEIDILNPQISNLNSDISSIDSVLMTIEQINEKNEALSTKIKSTDKKDLESTLETFENEEIEKTTLLAEISSLNNFIKDLNILSTEEVSSYNEKLEKLTIQKINITDYNEFISLTTPILNKIEILNPQISTITNDISSIDSVLMTIEQINEKNEALSTKIKSTDKKDLESTLETFENEENEKNNLTGQISSLNNSIKDFNTLSTEEVSAYNEKLEKLTIQKTNITDYNEFISLTTPILNKIEILNPQISTITNDISSIKEGFDSSFETIKDIDDKNYELQSIILKNNENITTLNSIVKNTSDFKDETLTFSELHTRTKNELSSALSSLDKTTLELKEYNEISSKIKSLKEKQLFLISKNTNYKSYLIKKNELEKSLIEFNDISEEILNTINSDKNELKHIIESKNTQLLENKKDQEVVEEKLNRFKELKQECIEIDNKNLLLSKIKNYSDRIKKASISEFFNNISSFINEIISSDKGTLGDLKLKISQKKNSNFDILVDNGGTEVKDISLLSGAEQGTVARAIYFALAQFSNFGVIWLDECDGMLSDTNKEVFIEMLIKMKDHIGLNQVFLISHNQNIISKIDKLIDLNVLKN